MPPDRNQERFKEAPGASRPAGSKKDENRGPPPLGEPRHAELSQMRKVLTFSHIPAGAPNSRIKNYGTGSNYQVFGEIFGLVFFNKHDFP